MATYGCVRADAELSGHSGSAAVCSRNAHGAAVGHRLSPQDFKVHHYRISEAAHLLQQASAEEGHATKELTHLATSAINAAAVPA